MARLRKSSRTIRIARDRLWQRNNSAGQSAGAERPDRLTLPANSAQIGLADGNLAFFSSWRSVSGLDFMRCSSPSRANRTGAGRSGSWPLSVSLVRILAIALLLAVAPRRRPRPSHPARRLRHLAARRRPQSDTDGDQFQFLGRLNGDQSRQQFSGAPGQPGDVRLRQGVAKQSGRRRRFREHGGAAVPQLGRGLRNLGHDRPAGLFRRRSPPDLWRRRGIGARVAPGVNVGLSVDQSHTAIDMPLALQSATLDLTQLGFNASVDKGPWTWAVALVHGFGKVNSSRDTGFGIATAGYNAPARRRADRAQLLLEHRPEPHRAEGRASNMCAPRPDRCRRSAASIR